MDKSETGKVDSKGGIKMFPKKLFKPSRATSPAINTGKVNAKKRQVFKDSKDRTYVKQGDKKVYVKKLLYVDENSIEESIMTLQNHKAVVCAEVLNDPKFAEQLPTKLKAPMNVRALGRIFSRG